MRTYCYKETNNANPLRYKTKVVKYIFFLTYVLFIFILILWLLYLSGIFGNSKKNKSSMNHKYITYKAYTNTFGLYYMHIINIIVSQPF